VELSPIADNVTVGGVLYATDDVGGVQAQIVKPAHGADGVATMTSTAAPFPVNVTSSAGNMGTSAGNLTAAAATATGTASSTSTVVDDVSQAGNVTVELTTAASTGAFVGTVVFESSVDPAGAVTRWDAIPAAAINPANPSGTTLALSLGAGVCRTYRAPMLGQSLFRVRCSAFTSGTLTVTIIPGPGWIENMPITQAQPPSTFSVTRVTTSGTANTTTTLLAADSNRKGVQLWHDGTTGPVSVSWGVAAANASNVFSMDLAPGGYLEIPPAAATGAITCFSGTASVPLNLSWQA
jgi:hypothetical protein